MHKLTAAALLVIAVSARAQAPSPEPNTAAPPPIAIHRASSSITIDGDLSEAAWQDAAKLENWVEGSPANNIPAKVKTVAYLSYDEKYFYVGIVADDPNPAKIRAPYVERDAVIGTDDNIALFLDTRGDRRTSYEIRVNPRGIQGDGIYDDAGPNEDFSPDYFYDTAAKITSTGWTAEFRIPFSSLRYSSRSPKFNLLVWRNYPRDFRYAFYSAPVPRGSNCLVCHAQEITGLADLPEAGHLTTAPYVASQRIDQPVGALGTSLGDHSLKTNVGADLKWTPSGTSALDLTLNPDFSQIEADVPQITVNQRFAVFFPEKRPFFLEGFDLFNTPIQALYTRTITSPRAGARYTGRSGDNAYTLLVTDDRGGGLTILPGPLGSGFAELNSHSYNAIGRMRHEMGKSFIGGLFTDREVSGGGHNRVLGPDFLWRPNEANSLTGQLLVSNTQGDELSGAGGRKLTSHAGSINYNFVTRRMDATVQYTDIGNDFRANLGFVPQVGYRELLGATGVHFYPEHSFFWHIRPSIVLDRQDDMQHTKIYDTVSLGLGANGRKNSFIGLLYRPTEQIFVGDRLLNQSWGQFDFQIDPSRRITRITLSVRGGEAIDFANARVGRGTNFSLSGTFRPLDRITLDLTSNRQLLNAAGGRVFTAQVERLRTLYSFSANSLLRFIAQYSSVSRDPSRYGFRVPQHSGDFLASLLYSYKLNWQTVLYLGYGDTRVLTSQNDLLRADRSVFFKVSYAIQK
jgi:hypothetical protein